MTLCRPALLLIACLGGACPSMAQDKGAGDVWVGTGLQADANGRTQSWTIRMSLAPGQPGRIDYPSLQCGGTLTAIGRAGGVPEYRERLTYGHGRCIDGGIVGVHPVGGLVIFYWRGEGSVQPDSAATAVLRRGG